MAGDEFYKVTTAWTAQEAFTVLVEQAKQEFRERLERDADLEEDGYPPDATYEGTVAAKEAFGFKMERPRPGESVEACVARCMQDDWHWAMEFDGPAACVDGGPDQNWPGHRVFHFFGLTGS